MVFWLMGISGAGKTTLGLKLFNFLKENNINSYLIDGDEIRSFFNNDLGYSKKERIENIKRIILSTYLLNKNGIVPIVCNISPFEELRKFCKEKIKDFNLIYINKNINESMTNDVKDVYHNNLGKTAIVGIDIVFEEPSFCDLQINVDELTIEESMKILLQFVNEKLKIKK